MLTERPDESNKQAALILARLDRIPAARWHVRVRFILGIATFFDAFDLLAVSFALPVLVERWSLSSQDVGMIISAAFFGQFIGAICFGWLAERYGRLFITNITVLIFGLASFGCAFAPNALILMALRFVQGIGLGGEVPIATTYITELARPEARGRFYILYELVFSVGLLVSAIAGWLLVPTIGWQSLFVLGGLPTFLVFFLRRALPESPRWLVGRRRLVEAEAAVALIEARVAAEGKPLQPPEIRKAEPAKAARLLDLVRPPYLARSLTVWALWLTCFSTVYGLLTWAPTLYRTVFHVSVSEALGYSVFINLCGIVGQFLCGLFIDRIGRRLWFAGALLGGALAFSIGCIVPLRSPIDLLLISAASYVFISTVAIGLNLYTPELYPTGIRAFATSIGGSWQRIAAAASPIIIGSVLPAFGLGGIFVFFSAMAFIGAVIAFAFATETAGRTLER